MGTWENNQNALREYANTLRGGIPSNYKNISNVALGSMINAAWARQAQEEAERKRLLEVQKQKDLDAAEERKLKLKKMQYELDDIENARNSKNLLNTLAPYKPSYGFDSDTGENITSGSTPMGPAFDALASASGLNLMGADYSKFLDDSAKAMSLYSSDPQKYKELSEKQKPMKDSVFTDEQILSLMADANDDDETRRKKNEELNKIMEPSRQKGRMTEDVLSGVLPPYEFSYQMRNKPTDVYKKEKDYDRSIYNADTGLAKAQIGADAKVGAANINANAKVRSAQINAEGNVKREKEKGEYKLKALELTGKQKELLKNKGIDINSFSKVASQYLNIYTQLWDRKDDKETAKDIQIKAQKRLIEAYGNSEEIINNIRNMRKGFSALIKAESNKNDIKAKINNIRE